MSIEIPEINIDDASEPSALLAQVSMIEEKHQNLVTLQSSIDGLERVISLLMALRSANISAILRLKKGAEVLEDEELQYLFKYLRDWDQLFLENFLELCGEWIPKEFQAAFQTESKIEKKWAQEWLVANSDQRIYKYPGLPWRSFIRKIVGENYNFAIKFLEQTALPGTPENIAEMHKGIRQFLEAKKKVVCVFPKRWGNKVEH
jgi:hypothetical protein